MGRRLYSNIAFDGMIFATVQDLAVHVGRAEVTVQRALRLGLLDTLGKGKGYRAPMPVVIAGERFSNAREAAKHYGVTAGAVWRAIDEGDPDRIARGRGGVPTHNAKPITIGPLTFGSYAEASRALGFSESYVSCAKRASSPVMWQNVLAAAMRLSAKREVAARAAACGEDRE